MAAVYLGLGSNIDAGNNLRLAIRELRRRFGSLTVSPVYRSAPIGFDGPDFLNLVVAMSTDADPLQLLEQIEQIHEAAGRSRGPDKFSSRPLDIDLLLYGFVLRPLADIAPDLVHPLSGRTIGEHWRDFDGTRHPLTPVDDIL